MIKSILFSFFIVGNSYATFPLIDIKNVYGEFLDDKGQAYAEKAFYVIPKAKIKHEDITLTFNRKAKSLLIQDPSTSVELDFDFSFLNVFKAFSFTGLYVKSDEKLFYIDSEKLDLFIEPKKYEITNFYVETDVNNAPTNGDEDVTVLDGLILNGQFKFKKLNFRDFDSDFFKNLLLENPESAQLVEEILKKRNKLDIPMIVRNASITLKEGDLSGRALIDSYINLWFRLNGKVATNKENTIITIHITRAKLGFLSIRSTLMRMIRDLKLNNVQVQGNKITVDLSAIILGGGAEPLQALKR